MMKCPDFLHPGPDIPWSNPECTGIGNQPPRAHLHSYENEAQAFEGNPSKSPFFQLLDGTWKFRIFPKPGVLEADVISQEMDDSSWESVEVQGNWTMQGHDRPHYTHCRCLSRISPPKFLKTIPQRFTEPAF